jgi:hypothetical protein
MFDGWQLVGIGIDGAAVPVGQGPDIRPQR